MVGDKGLSKFRRFNSEELEQYKEWGHEIEERTCKHCGVVFLAPDCASEQEKRYCSLEHQKISENDEKEFKCQWCGNKIKSYHESKFCNPICEAKGNLDKKYDLKKINWDKVRHSLKHLAEEKISGKDIKQGKCKMCGDVFLFPDQGKKEAKYCSVQCNYLDTKRYGVYPYEVFFRDNFRCRYCGRKPVNGAKLTVDHVYPQSKGGGDDLLNLVTACKRCNSHKQATLWDKELIKEIWQKNYELIKNLDQTSYDKMKQEFLDNVD